MKGKALLEIQVLTTREAEAAVCELLHAATGLPAWSYTDAETGGATAAVCGDAQSLPRAVGLAARSAGLPDWEAALAHGLARLRDCGLETGPARVTVRRLKPQDWAESWKRHFRPLAIGRALLVRPSWSRRRALAGQRVVVLDPGLSFGTGQHPTTAYCLTEIARAARLRGGRSFLDLGTGSGILAIAAAKLGFAPVRAFDHDADAVRVARRNARRNRVAERVSLATADLAALRLRVRRRHDLVCANLVADLLLAERRRIVAHVRPGGWLVLAGILAAEFGQVQAAYETLGFRLLRARTEKEWRSGTFAAPPAPRTIPHLARRA